MSNLRPLSEIAADIRRAWVDKSGRPCVNYAAEPYLSALSTLTTMNDRYGYDSATSVVLYFLSNASSFRGEDARRLKDDLRSHLRAIGYKL